MGPCRRRGEVKEWGKIQKNNRFSNTEWNGGRHKKGPPADGKVQTKHASGLAFTLLFIVTSDIQPDLVHSALRHFIPGNLPPLPNPNTQSFSESFSWWLEKQRDLIRIRSPSLPRVGHELSLGIPRDEERVFIFLAHTRPMGPVQFVWLLYWVKGVFHHFIPSWLESRHYTRI